LRSIEWVAETLAKEGIDIQRGCATAASEDEKCLLVFHSSSHDDALVKLKGG
jgi:hypothetical protein